MLLFWCSWFKYRFIKPGLATAGKFCFPFICVLGSVVDCDDINSLNYALQDAQNVCSQAKVGTILISYLLKVSCVV